MKFTRTRRGDLGLAAMILLARSSPALLTAAEIAEGVNGSVPLMHEIMRTLTRSGLIAGQPSFGGGYRLSKAASEVSALEIVELLEGPVMTDECPLWGRRCRWESVCPRLVSDIDPSLVCPLHSLWQPIREATARALEGLSLMDLAARDELAEALAE